MRDFWVCWWKRKDFVNFNVSFSGLYFQSYANEHEDLWIWSFWLKQLFPIHCGKYSVPVSRDKSAAWGTVGKVSPFPTSHERTWRFLLLCNPYPLTQRCHSCLCALKSRRSQHDDILIIILCTYTAPVSQWSQSTFPEINSLILARITDFPKVTVQWMSGAGQSSELPY